MLIFCLVSDLQYLSLVADKYKDKNNTPIINIYSFLYYTLKESIDVANHLYELTEKYKLTKAYIATNSVHLFREIQYYYRDSILLSIAKPTDREFQDVLVKLNNGEIRVSSEATIARKLIQTATKDTRSLEYLALLNAYRLVNNVADIHVTNKDEPRKRIVASALKIKRYLR